MRHKAKLLLCFCKQDGYNSFAFVFLFWCIFRDTRREERGSVLKTSGIEYKLLLVTSVKGHIGKESDAFEH